jgi:hypothetical protein
MTYYGWHDLPQGLWIINEYFKFFWNIHYICNTFKLYRWMYSCHFPITWRIECTRNQILQEYNFIPGVGNFAQGFCPEGVAFDIFFCKNVKSPPLARPPPPPSGLTLIGALGHILLFTFIICYNLIMLLVDSCTTCIINLFFFIADLFHNDTLLSGWQNTVPSHIFGNWTYCILHKDYSLDLICKGRVNPYMYMCYFQ